MEMEKPKKLRLARKTMPLELPGEAKALLAEIMPKSCQDYQQHMGRPSSYNLTTVRGILSNLLRGLPLDASAHCAGIAPSTVYKWRHKHPDFEQALARAQSGLMVHLLDVIHAGFDKNPRLALELLERRFPKEFGLHRQEPEASVTINLMGPGWLQRLGEARMRRDQAQGAGSPGPALDAI